MTDLANIGFKADTKDLERAKVSLEKLQNAARGVSKETSAMSVTVARDSYNVSKANTAAARAALSNITATDGVTAAQKRQLAESYKVAIAEEKKAKAMYDAANAARKLSLAERGLTQTSLTLSKKSTAAAQMIASGQGSMPAMPVVANDQMPNRFNTANIAAQFQDIGVTASMGMNPMVIALQQGTQLSAIINSMESPLAGIGEAFKSIINPISLLSIVLVGLTAALVQFIDWTSVGASVTNAFGASLGFLGQNIDVIVFAVTMAGVAFAAWNYQMVVAAAASGVRFVQSMMASTASIIVNTATANINIVAMARMGAASLAAAAKMAAAWVLANPLTVFIAAFAAITAAMIIFRENFAKVFGVDIVDFAKKGVNFIIGVFVGAFKYIGQIASNLWNIIAGDMEFSFSNLGQGAGEAFTNALDVDYIGKVGMALEGIGSKLKNVAGGMGEVSAAAKGAGSSVEEGLAKAEESTDKLKERMEFAKDVSKGFFDDLKSDLKKGELSWASFANAIINALNKIADKMFDQILSPVFDGLGEGIGSLFNAKGNAFGSSGVQAFANGGTFTNGLYDKPTMFTYAKGGSFGVMGEAGPEAVMPLQRGPDGSLGVKNYGGSGGGGVNIVINNNAGANVTTQQRQTENGMDLMVMIDQAVAKNMASSNSLTSKALTSVNSRQLVKR